MMANGGKSFPIVFSVQPKHTNMTSGYLVVAKACCCNTDANLSFPSTLEIEAIIAMDTP